MSPLFDFFFGPYAEYSTLEIALEATAIVFGLWSVWFAQQNRIGVYPTGLLSTGIYVYLLWQWNLLGDMLINTYYFGMSIYGWYFWTQKSETTAQTPISQMTSREGIIGSGLFLAAALLVIAVYDLNYRWHPWTSPIDTFTTGIFFVGMWLMARRKIEHWYFWIVGDIISIPLYFYKGYTLTSLQYLIFTYLAIQGLRKWKKNFNTPDLKV